MPAKVDKLYKEVKKNNPDYSDEKAWATAWSIFCRYHDSPHCKRPKSKYLKKKKAYLNIWFLGCLSDLLCLMKKDG